MKFYKIQLPVMVTGDGRAPASELLTLSITTSDHATAGDAVDLLADKLSEALKLVDIGDEE